MSGNGHDLNDGDDRMRRALLVAKMRQEAAETILRGEQLVEELRAAAPPSDAAAYTAPPEPEPESEPQQTNAGLVSLANVLRAEFETQLETSAESHRAFVTELLELCATGFAEKWNAAVDDLGKIVTVELRELRSTIARAEGRAGGETQALRDELTRAKGTIEELRSEVTELRSEFARSQGRKLEAVRT